MNLTDSIQQFAQLLVVAPLLAALAVPAGLALVVALATRSSR